MKLSILLLVLAICSFAAGSRVLFLFPSPSESHLIVVKGLSTTLAERGHDVTVVSPFPLKKPMKNYRDIKVEVPQDMQDLKSSMVTKSNENIFKSFPRLLTNLFEMGNNMLKMQEFKKLMDEEKFDLVVIGMFFNNYLLGVGDHFKCPTMMLSVSGAQTFLNVLMGNPLGVTSVKHQFFDSDVKTFGDRLKNFLIHGVDFAMIAYLENLQKKNYECVEVNIDNFQLLLINFLL
jgi:glucuronosyltransferase